MTVESEQAGGCGPGADFGRQLRAYRRRAGLTQQQLGRMVGYHHSLISRLEAGLREPAAGLVRLLDTGTGTAAHATTYTLTVSGGGGGGETTWAAYQTYAAGDIVTYQGTRYTCLQGHTALPGWEPPNVPALWQSL